jgi:hypothetical protein
LAAAKVKYRYGWMHHPIVFAPNNANELLTGANVVFESKDQGRHWQQLSPDLTRNDKSKQQRPGGPISADVTGEESFDTLSSVAVSPLSDYSIWTGSDDGLVYVTRNGGGHWQQVRPPSLPKWATITCIEPSHAHKGTAYVTASRFDWDDFKPYVYKTTDYGKHWTKVTSGLPDNQYVESVRQDPNAPDLLFVGTSKTVYMSLDGGREWQPLGLNLPPVRVEDIAIQPAQHAVVLATFGRAFWVLDNLQFLEQLRQARVDRDAPYLFKPQQTWLVKRSSGRRKQPNTGENRPAGATVFFHLPANYSGQHPVKLAFTDAHGHTVRSYTLHLKTKKNKKSKTQHGASTSAENLTPMQRHKKQMKKKTAVSPGMNRFQWNMHYPAAAHINGVYNSFFAAARPIGPEVVPGTYDVKLSYGDTTLKQPFVVKLDPRLNVSQAQLQQRFDLLMNIHKALDRLDNTLNRAIDARDQLQKALAHKRLSGGRATEPLKRLNHDIGQLVDLKIQSGEGALVYPPRLRAWLTSIASDISLSFAPPTQSQKQVAKMYIKQAHAGVSRLQSDIASAKGVRGSRQ